MKNGTPRAIFHERGWWYQWTSPYRKVAKRASSKASRRYDRQLIKEQERDRECARTVTP